MVNADSKVPRTEAARRQLDAAIQLWLDDGDPLAVLTLAMASYRLLKDLTAAKDKEFFLRSNELLKANRGYEKLIKTANALKHADHDPLAAVMVPTHESNETLLGGALVFFRVVTGDVSALMGAFHLMMLSTHPERFLVAPDEDPDIEAAAQNASKLLQTEVTARRLLLHINLDLIDKGVLPRNTNLRRRHDT